MAFRATILLSCGGQVNRVTSFLNNKLYLYIHINNTIHTTLKGIAVSTCLQHLTVVLRSKVQNRKKFDWFQMKPFRIFQVHSRFTMLTE